MLNQIINTVIPVVATAIGAVLVAVIKVVGDNAVSFLETKKAALVAQTGIDKYNATLQKAKSIWNLVDEEFRITPTLEKTVEAKQEMFNKLLKSKIPSLTDSEINDIRQAIAGEVNKGKDVVTSDAVAKQNELNNIKTQNVQLTAENNQLKQKLATIQSTAAVQK